jgi:DNA-cytosine methyltransferase
LGVKCLNVLSLFGGIECGRVALERAGITVDKYFSSEIDKYAIQIAQKNYPDIIQLGDINNIDFSKYIGKIDLILGGSPCTFWSIAKRNREINKRGEGWKLFNKYLEAINIIKPKYFLYENVASMPITIKNFISEEFKYEPIMINSALISAQQRKRLYWTNIHNVTQPKDKNIYLQNILESGFTDRLKSYCIDASYFKGGNLEQYFEKKRRQLVFEKPYRVGYFNSGGQGDRVYASNGKSVTLSANGGGRGAKTGLYLIPDKANCLRARCNNESLSIKEIERVINKNIGNLIVLDNGDQYIIRKLTPIECERLQTLKDNYTEGVSNTQRYKMLGNGWTVDVVAHILSYINKKLKIKN